MSSLRINLFGDFRIWRGEDLIEGKEWDRQKTRSLLKLLLTRPGEAFSKDEIVDALWPGVAPEAAEHRLRMTVSVLRRVLEPDLERGSDSGYVLRKRPGYSFNEWADCWVDAWEFDVHRKSAEAALEAGGLEEAVAEYRAALDLVRGELLAEDPYEEWAIQARQEWRDLHLSALSGLAECQARRGNYTEAIGLCERAVTLDRFGEELRRRLMLYHYCTGEQALALQVYRDYAETLKDELSTEPSPELARLKKQIESRDVPGVDEGRRRYPKPRRPLKLPYSLSRTHFAGREKEYAWLVERLREAAGGNGGTVAIEGEAGVGKTRLAEEFLGYARSHNVRVFMARCYERELAAPLEPVIEAMEPVVKVEEEGGVLFGRPGEELDEPWAARPHDITRTYHALTRKLIEESRAAGQDALILFVDDVQWADPATLEFLSYLARRILPERILLLVAHRREDGPRLSGWRDRLSESRAMSTLSLSRLSMEQLTLVLSRMSSRSFGALPSLAAFLHRESEGNPFYAIEYLRWLIESDNVEIDSRRRICGLKGEALQGGALPSGVHALIQARLPSFGERTRSLLEHAAVVGRIFDPGLLSRVAALETTGTSEAIEPLKSSGLVVETAGGAYYFSHDKLRQALYEGIDDCRRRELHLRVAEVLERDDGAPAELVHHYLRAGEWRLALDNLVKAGRKAEEGYAWSAALDDYSRALEVLEKLPDLEETKFELLSARERLLEHLGRHHERAEAVQEMLELASLKGDLNRIAEMHIRRVGVLMALSDPAGAERAGRAAVAILQESGDRTGQAQAYRELGYVLWTGGKFAGALEANFEALHIHRELGDRTGEAGDAGNIAQVYRGMKRFDEALRWAGGAARIDRELGDKLGEGFRLNTTATVHQERGELEAALSLHLRSLSLVSEAGAKNLSAAQHMNCGRLYLRLGDPRMALEHFRTAGHLGREMGYGRDEGYALVNMGVALERLEDLAGAADAYRRASRLLQTAHEESGSMEELFGKAEALTLLGRILHRRLDKPLEALDAYESATAIYRILGDTGRLRKLLLEEGGLLWRMGDPKGSASRYEEALELARECENPSHKASALASLSVVYRDLGHLHGSLRCGRQAVELLREVEDLQAEAFVLTSLADSYRELGNDKSALSCLKRSFRLRQKTGDARGEVGVLRDMAEVYEKLDEKGHARSALREAARKEDSVSRVL